MTLRYRWIPFLTFHFWHSDICIFNFQHSDIHSIFDIQTYIQFLTFRHTFNFRHLVFRHSVFRHTVFRHSVFRHTVYFDIQYFDIQSFDIQSISTFAFSTFSSVIRNSVSRHWNFLHKDPASSPTGIPVTSTQANPSLIKTWGRIHKRTYAILTKIS